MVRAVNSVGEKDCTLALNFGGGAESEDNVPARYLGYGVSILLCPESNITNKHLSTCFKLLLL